MELEVRVLGPVEALVDGVPLDLGGAKEQALLGLLALHLGHIVSTDRVIDALWDGDPSPGATTTLRTYVTRLRRSLGPAGVLIETASPGYRLRADAVTLDTTQFEELWARGRQHLDAGEPADAAGALADALALFRGPAFGDLAVGEWARSDAARLDELRLAVVEDRITADLANGRHTEVVAELQSLTGQHPLREGLWAKRVLALYRCGRQADALRAYQELRTQLGDELGIEPSVELRDLEGAVLRQDPGLMFDAPDSETVLPGGVVTFLFTDIEASTRGWQDRGDSMVELVDRHDVALREAVEPGGVIFKHTGDGLCAAFERAELGIAAALAAQRSLSDANAPNVRMALHTGAATPRGGDYRGLTLSRAARLLETGHGGQILVSDATAHLVADELPPGVEMIGLGEFVLRDVDRPQRVFQLSHPSLCIEFPPVRAVPVRRSNIPPSSTSFIGRDDDVARVIDALASNRLVTLTGVGGAGKTRLAVEVGRRLERQFPDGAWLCELATIVSADSVDDVVAAALGFHPEQGMSVRDSTRARIGDRDLLLILDNCEHLLAEAAGLAQDLLSHADQLRILATSREGLSVGGEQILALGSLAQPDGTDLESIGRAAAVQLFVDRAQHARATFDLNDSNANAVAGICRRVDGIPLAIELAAARSSVLSPSDIETRLESSFALLRGGSRSAVERHLTLQRTIDWSHDLLGGQERRLFRRLGVFAGGFTLEAIEAVCGDPGTEERDEQEVLDVLSHLVDKSLVIVDDDGRSVRYRLLEPIRHYSADRLQEAEEIEDASRRHALFFFAVGARAGALLEGPDEMVGVAMLEAEVDNLRLAVTWSVDHGDPAPALRLVAPLHWYKLPPRLEREVTAWSARIASLHGAAEFPDCELALVWAAMGAQSTGQGAKARELIGAAFAVSARHGTEPHPLAAFCQNYLRWMEGDVDGSLAGGEDNAATVRSTGKPDVIAMCLAGTSVPLGHLEPEAALVRAEEALVWAHQSGSPSSLLFATHCLALVTLYQPPEHRDVTRAIQLFDEASAMEGVGQSLWALVSSGRAAYLRIDQGDIPRGIRDLHRTMQLSASVLGNSDVLMVACNAAMALAAVGQRISGATVWAAVTEGTIGDFVPAPDELEFMAGLDLDEHEARRARDRGRSFTRDQLVDYTLEELDRVAAPSA